MSGWKPGGHGTDDAERTIVVGRFDRAATNRDGAGRTVAVAGAGPMADNTARIQRTG